MVGKSFSLSANELQLYQPNRYPFLMIDRVTDVMPGKYAIGFKNLTNNEWYFPKHFENHPNMPGALQLEAMAQMLTVAITTIDGLKGKITHALEHTVRFKKEVLPGDRLDIKAELISWKRGIGKGRGICTVEGVEVSSADMTITIPEILERYLPNNGKI
ncbi:3-hydroxyacyl-ACP dehydratase FabZ [Prochlorococcus marinus]|uniref:3-hydroxyacyl-ACP dehydratase FabZ n=1 Tax=Prochlorococcus marinus TaxID=1219 RepID=UPI0022B2F49D|nr:3-hydroxyacyl-ACP dehydratase FabZ [Prochlorococcus marinus]